MKEQSAFRILGTLGILVHFRHFWVLVIDKVHLSESGRIY